MALISEKHRKLELKDGATSLGLFDFEEQEYGTEGGEISYDPETGPQHRSGVDTAEPFAINRPWDHIREPQLADQLMALKNAKAISAFIWTIDPATKRYATSEPEDTLSVMIKTVKKPGGKAGSGDEPRIEATIAPLPL